MEKRTLEQLEAALDTVGSDHRHRDTTVTDHESLLARGSRAQQDFPTAAYATMDTSLANFYSLRRALFPSCTAARYIRMHFFSSFCSSPIPSSSV